MKKNLPSKLLNIHIPGAVLFLCFLFVAVVTPALAEVQHLEVYESESIVLALDFQFSEYALGNPAIADAIVRTNDDNTVEMIINGKNAGLTNLIFWDKSGAKRAEYSIKVKAREINELLKEVRLIIGTGSGLRAEIMDNKVVIKGEALSPVIMARVIKLAKDKQGVINLAGLSNTAMKVLMQTIKSFIGEGSQVKVKVVGQALILQGVSYGKGSAGRIEKFATIYHSNVVNLIEERDISLIPGRGKTIQVYAHFVEVKKTAMKAYGFNWRPFGTAEAGGTYGRNRTKDDSGITHSHFYAGQISGFFSNLLPKFSNARERSMGRQLKVASLSVRSGEEATFQSGGEIGIPVIGNGGATSVTFKKYGVKLQILPISHGDYITLKITVRINYPVSQLSFTLSEVTTVQDCKSGNSIALAGLLDNVDKKTFDASPGGGDALFELFRSSEFQKDESDLVIFITPEIFTHAKNANIEMKQQVLDAFDSYEPLSR